MFKYTFNQVINGIIISDISYHFLIYECDKENYLKKM